jgi:hypothetical protein
MYIIYLTRSQWSDYSVEEILIGEVDPEPLLNQWCSELSGGKYPHYGSVKDCGCGYHWCGDTILCLSILKQLPDKLKSVGFKVAQATEVWLG